MSSNKQTKKEFQAYCVISNEETRRIHCNLFPNLIVTTGQIEDFIPNVCYYCTVVVKNKEEDEVLKTIPSNRLKLKGIWGVKFDEESNDFIAGAPWEPDRYVPRVHPLYPKSILLSSDHNKVISSECIVINEREVFIVHRPNHRGMIGLIIPGDFMYVDGRLIGCELYFCRYNNAYIVYGYYPHPESKGGFHELAWCTPMDIGLENPMNTQLKPGGVKEFLGYVKLCRFNHFFCSYCIPLILDPKNLLHGRVALGDSNNEYEKEKEQNVGIRVWIRFYSERKLFRWEIVELFKATAKLPALWERHLPNELEDVKHEEFVSVGLKINRKGSVYCPHVCNFPIYLNEETTIENELKVELGDWFKFCAFFNEEKKIYQILNIIEIVEHKKYLMKEMEGEDDVFLFNIPLVANYFVSKHLLYDEDFGFVEDVNLKIIMFTIEYEETHPDTYHKEKNVWCRENPDIKNRLVPFCVVDILEPDKGSFI